MGAPKIYLSLGDIAVAEGVDVATVSKWRDRFADFPEPDIRLGRRGQWPGWDETRLAEIAAWRRNRSPAGGRPRHISVDEAHTIGLPLAEWIAAGDTPRVRTQRLVRIHHAVERLDTEFVRQIEAETGVRVENEHVRAVLCKPQGNKAGDHARGLVHVAVQEHIAQFSPRIEFAPHRFDDDPDVAADPDWAVAHADKIVLHAPDGDGQWEASRTPNGWAVRTWRGGLQREVQLHDDAGVLGEVRQMIGDGWTPEPGEAPAPAIHTITERITMTTTPTTEYASWGSIPGNGYREFDHEVAASLDDPAAYDVPALISTYRDAINAALPDGVSLAGDEFLGPYPAPDDARERIGEAIGSVDFWALAERHAR